MENNATSCPRERKSSITSNRYASVPLKRKLYLLQNRILINSLYLLEFEIRNSTRTHSYLRQQELAECRQIPLSIEVLDDVISCSTSRRRCITRTQSLNSRKEVLQRSRPVQESGPAIFNQLRDSGDRRREHNLPV